MALNPKYMIAPNLQEIFLDKATGLPLVNGKVYYYSDVNRNVPKTVYQYVSTDPNLYVALPNPVDLTAIGTTGDSNGNDVRVYYYPFDAAGNIENYFIKVYDQNGVHQFDREAWPNETSADVVQGDFTNFVANGQFLIHNNNPPALAQLASTGIDYQPIAPGGWYFARSHSSTATDKVTFPVFQNYTDSPTGSPRFAAELKRTVASNDTVCDFRLRFYDVNKFASDSQEYLLQFTCQSNSGSPLNGIQLNLFKYFGTGTNSPSAPTNTTLDTFDAPITETVQTFTFTFGTNASKSIGNNNDDFVELCIHLPSGASSTFDFQITDVILTLNNNQVISIFPPTPDSDFLSDSLPGYLPVPNPDGSDLYLPIILSTTGFNFDRTQIGTIKAAVYPSPGIGELLCDGSGYLTSGYSNDGIPYSRLQKVLYNNGNSYNVPIFGTGYNFGTGYISHSNAAILRIATNNNSTVSATPGSGTPSTPTALTGGTTFTGGNVTPGLGQNTDTDAFMSSTNVVTIIGTTPSAGTIANGTGSAWTLASVINNTVSYPVMTITMTGVPVASDRFTITSNGNTYSYWFKVNGSGTASGGGTQIEIDILSTMTKEEVAEIIQAAINGGNITDVTCVAASAITEGSYFSYFAGASNNKFTVWYTKSGATTPPVVASTFAYIRVSLTGTETNAQVATLTQQAINSASIGVPDFRGMFLRGVKGTGGADADSTSRPGFVIPAYGNQLGSFEYDQNQSHLHGVGTLAGTAAIVGSYSGGNGSPPNFVHMDGVNSAVTITTAPPVTITGSTASSGGSESKPYNAYVNWFIKY